MCRGCIVGLERGEKASRAVVGRSSRLCAEEKTGPPGIFWGASPSRIFRCVLRPRLYFIRLLEVASFYPDFNFSTPQLTSRNDTKIHLRATFARSLILHTGENKREGFFFFFFPPVERGRSLARNGRGEEGEEGFQAGTSRVGGGVAR